MKYKTRIYKGDFDPKTVDNPVFKKRISTVLWCEIRRRHLADQYFNEKIMKATDELEKCKDLTYEEFMKIRGKYLHQFGLILKRGGFPPFSFPTSKPNHSFWRQVYYLIVGKRDYKFERIN